MKPNATQCFVDESIYDSLGVVVTAFVFADDEFEDRVTLALREAGLDPPREEFKSGARMDSDPRMRDARSRLLGLAASRASVAVFFGPFSRARLGRQALQAVQSTFVRNGIDPSNTALVFDQGIFSSSAEAARLRCLFSYLAESRIDAGADSRVRVGIQVADAVAHCFGQIIKESLTGDNKMVDIGGPDTGYEEGTEATLSWSLLMSLRYALLTRPVVCNGQSYDPRCDPVVLDPLRDDPIDFCQNPVLLGWGVQIAPESEAPLRQAVESALGRLWLGCIH